MSRLSRSMVKAIREHIPTFRELDHKKVSGELTFEESDRWSVLSGGLTRLFRPDGARLSEERSSFRIPYRVAVSGMTGRTSFQVLSYDLSSGGIATKHLADVRPGQLVRLTFELTLRGFLGMTKKHVFTIPATCQWSSSKSKRTGFSFVDASSEQRAQLHRLTMEIIECRAKQALKTC